MADTEEEAQTMYKQAKTKHHVIKEIPRGNTR